MDGLLVQTAFGQSGICVSPFGVGFFMSDGLKYGEGYFSQTHLLPFGEVGWGLIPPKQNFVGGITFPTELLCRIYEKVIYLCVRIKRINPIFYGNSI